MTPKPVTKELINDWLGRLGAETDQAALDETFTAYLRTMSRFWRYSTRNSMLIFVQRPQATHVGGRTTLWEPLGYRVKADEVRHGIWIKRPATKAVEDEATGETRDILLGFDDCLVYDRDQVEPARPDAQPLDAPWVTLSGDYDDLYALLVRTCTALTMTVILRDDLPSAVEGRSNGEGRIELNARAAVGNRAQTLIHEMAHEVCHPRITRARFTLQEVECQAEAVSYVVSQALGLPTPNAPTYLALYRVTRNVIKANAEAIQVGVRTILSEVERASSQATEAAA